MKHLKQICAASVLVLALTLTALADCGNMSTPCPSTAPTATGEMGTPGVNAPATVDATPDVNPVGEIICDFLLTMLAML